MTYLLIALNIGIWLWTLTAGASLLQAPTERLLYWGGNAASEVQRGEWWRLLTSTFLHNGMMHVLMNMLGLYVAGIIVERIYGRNLFLLIYFGSGLLGSATSLHYSAQHAVSVGASGAVFGVTGALLVAYLQHRDKLPKASSKQMISGLGFFIVYALMQGFAKQGIDNAAHVGGLLGGCLLAYILPERFDIEHYKKTVSRHFATGTAISAFLIAGAVHEAPQATVDQSRIFASVEIAKRGFTNFQDSFKEVQQLHGDMQSGKLSEWDGDIKGRTVLAPRFREVVKDLKQVVLHPNDPRKDMLKDFISISELMAEALAMESIQVGNDPKPQPANPERMAQIEAEILRQGELMKTHIEQLNKKK
jgi:rhomboid protease GluP